MRFGVDGHTLDLLHCLTVVFFSAETRSGVTGAEHMAVNMGVTQSRLTLQDNRIRE